uniref:Uncharacterized protein n=1 Tax=Setaria italica TaxID=4555 RepID=K4A4K7_SETIT
MILYSKSKNLRCFFVVLQTIDVSHTSEMICIISNEII